jgi:CheY-like chemotaxis protein
VPAVLIVDDDPDILALHGIAFELRGWSVTRASSVSSALGLAARRVPDVLITDLAMPGSDGLDLATRLRALVGNRPLPILLVTGQLLSLRRADTLPPHLSVCQVLVKPVDPDDLVDVATGLVRSCGHDCGGPRYDQGFGEMALTLRGCDLHRQP